MPALRAGYRSALAYKNICEARDAEKDDCCDCMGDGDDAIFTTLARIALT
jgi:hypothetical protein